MRRRIIMALLALGAIGGYAHAGLAFAHMHHACRGDRGEWHSHADCADQHRDSR